MVQKILNKLTEGVDNNRRHVASVELNIAFLGGNQWIEGSEGDGIHSIDNPANDMRVTDNRMIQVYQWKMLQYFRERPVIVAFGSGSEILDEERAAVASRLADHFRQNNGWEEAEKEAASWLEVGGAAYMSPVWRSKPGLDEEIEIPVFTGHARLDENNQLTFSKQVIVKRPGGDVAFDTWNTLQTFTFPQNESKWTRINEVLTADLVSFDWARTHLRIDINEDGLHPTHAAEINLSAIERTRSAALPGFNIYNNDFPHDEKRYLLLQWRQRPSPEFPKGRFIIVLGDYIVHDDVLPYVEEANAVDPNDEFNMTMGIIPWFAYALPGFLIPPAPMSILREHQIRLNRLRTDEERNRRTVGRNKIFYDETMIDENAFTGEHGEMIPMSTVGGQFNIHTIQGKPLVGISAEIQRAEQAFDDAAGRSSLFRGENPPQVRSAFHLDILREEGQTMMTAFIRGREQFHERVAKLALEIARRRYTKKRIIEIFGRDKAGMALTYRSANIYTDIIVKEGSSLPRNKAAKEAKALELFKQGAFQGPDGINDTDLLWEMLELGTLNRALTGTEKHRNRAKLENRMILLGELSPDVPLIPLEHEDHVVHIETHQNEMASPEFYDADEARQAFLMTHVGMHNNFLTLQMAPESGVPPDQGMTGEGQPGIPGAPPGAAPPEGLQLLPPGGAPVAVGQA